VSGPLEGAKTQKTKEEDYKESDDGKHERKLNQSKTGHGKRVY